MRHILAIAGRELGSIFGTSVAYVLMAAYMLISGFLFFASLGLFLTQIQQIQAMGATQYLAQFNLNDMLIAPVYGTCALVLVFMVPLLSMRAFAQERETGSIELLLTAQITSWQMALGKYLAILAVVAVITLLTGL